MGLVRRKVPPAKLVVAASFLLGAAAIALLTVSLPLGVLLAFVAVVGLGTSGTQILIYGFVATYYRTNVRSAGVAWYDSPTFGLRKLHEISRLVMPAASSGV